MGYQTWVLRFPDHAFVVAVLCNLTAVNAHAVAVGVADIFLERVLPPRAAIVATPLTPVTPLTAEQIAALVGLYRDSSSGELRRVFARDGRLQVVAGGRTPSAEGNVMTALGADRFSVFDGSVTMEFTPPAPGRPRGFREAFPAGQRLLVFQRELEVTVSSAQRRAYAGLYDSPDLRITYRLFERDSSLVLEIPRRDGVRLQPAFADAFVGDGNPVQLIRFTRDAQRAVTGFALTGGGFSDLRFNRVR